MTKGPQDLAACLDAAQSPGKSSSLGQTHRAREALETGPQPRVPAEQEAADAPHSRDLNQATRAPELPDTPRLCNVGIFLQNEMARGVAATRPQCSLSSLGEGAPEGAEGLCLEEA